MSGTDFGLRFGRGLEDEGSRDDIVYRSGGTQSYLVVDRETEETQDRTDTSNGGGAPKGAPRRKEEVNDNRLRGTSSLD